MKFFWFLTIAGCAAGGLVLFVTLATASGAPQEASGAAVAVEFAVIPYCLTRSLQLWNSGESPKRASGTQRCPFCDKIIKERVAKCCYCTSTLNQTKTSEIEQIISDGRLDLLKKEESEEIKRARASGMDW